MARKARSLFYNLGSMFGNIAAGVKADARAPVPARLAGSASGPEGARDFGDASPTNPASAQPSHLVQQRVQEVVVNTPRGPVVLRRTVTDEVRVPPAQG